MDENTEKIKKLIVLDSKKGHIETSYTQATVSLAEELFSRYSAEGRVSIAEYSDGSSKHIDTFDPAADKIYMIYPLSGG